MSEFTFNIADYRPLSVVRTHRVQETRSQAKRPSDLVVVTSNFGSREREEEWMEASPAVVDIRAIREGHRNGHSSGHISGYPRRGKILRFTNEAPERVVTMARPDSDLRSGDDPDPDNYPTAA
jgi:hypothetical protein